MLRTASAKRKKIATLLAFSSIPLSGFITDIYLPSFPSMARDLQVSEHQIQITLTVFFLSYGISQLFIGSILDNIGRYRPRLVALVVLTVCSLLITLTTDVLLISMLRVIQGVAISVVVISTRAFFVDLYKGEQLKHYLSFFTMVWSCGPILAPFLGGYLEKYFNWQANFYFLAAYALVLLVLDLIYGGETIEKFKKFNMVEVLSSYKMMLTNRMFILGIVTLGFSYSVVMVFNISGPFVLENNMHFNSVVIGYCTLILGFSWMIGGYLSKRLGGLNFDKQILYCALVQIGLVIALVVISPHYEHLAILISFAFLVHICSGFLYTIFFTRSMLFFPKNAGIAGGLLGGLVYIFTSISSYLISSVGHIDTQGDLSLRYLVTSLLLLVIVCCTVYLHRKYFAIDTVPTLTPVVEEKE